MDQGVNLRLLLTASGDWDIHACGVLAERLQQHGCEVFVAHSDPGLETPPVRAAWPGPVLPLSPMQVAVSDLCRHVDAIGVFARPERVQEFRQTYRLACQLAKHPAAPVFSGPSQPLSGDLLEEDLLGRLDCELLCLHGPEEAEVLQELTQHSHRAPPASVQLGLWQVPDQPHGEQAADFKEKRIVFLEQQDFPATSSSRHRLLRLLENLANRLSDWTVVIQPDYRQLEVDEEMDNGLGALLQEKRQHLQGRSVTNLVVGGEAGLPAVLNHASLAATLTSGATLMAVARGIPVLALADFGFSSTGNSAFWMGSGVMGRLEAIEKEEQLLQLPRVQPDWFRTIGGDIRDGAERLLTALCQLKEVARG